MTLSRPPGVGIETLDGGVIAAFSPLSGESHLINPEAALVLDLASATPAPRQELARRVAAAAGLETAEAIDLLQPAWAALVDAGLLRQHGPDEAGSAVADAGP